MTTKRTKLMVLKVSDDERAMLECVAQANGENLSQTIRRLIRQAAQTQRRRPAAQVVGGPE